jgi:hypothetical protein
MSVDGSDPFEDAVEEVATPRGYRARSYSADPRSASPRETRGRKRGREVSPGPILDRKARASRPTSFTFPSLLDNDI